ncbi:Pr6Pr family membrane protein [Agrococcus casei]|uniref:Pr6Pr family membrane protein n=1 Tax=Agrococcus casei TaxID=343512 RepID=UPI003F91851B
MTTPPSRNASLVGVGRAATGVTMVAVLAYAYALRIAAEDGNPFDFCGYFTNQTSLATALVLIAAGVLSLAGRRAPGWFSVTRGIVTGYLLVVALVYNVLVPGTGSAPPWVSILLHIVFPAVVALDWLLIGDRPPLPWRHLWTLLPHPILWLTVVLIRGATDGWVPYGFLLVERGIPSLFAHVVGILAVIVASGALVWLASRARGIVLRRKRE